MGLVLAFMTGCSRSVDSIKDVKSLTSEYDFGGGTIEDYANIMKKVAEQEEISIVDMQKAWTLTKDNWSKYLVDGAHLKKDARREYANYLAKELNEIFGSYKILKINGGYYYGNEGKTGCQHLG